jgi:hypothetical protein
VRNKSEIYAKEENKGRKQHINLISDLDVLYEEVLRHSV